MKTYTVQTAVGDQTVKADKYKRLPKGTLVFYTKGTIVAAFMPNAEIKGTQ